VGLWLLQLGRLAANVVAEWNRSSRDAICFCVVADTTVAVGIDGYGFSVFHYSTSQLRRCMEDKLLHQQFTGTYAFEISYNSLEASGR
jgi:hypothetical protein